MDLVGAVPARPAGGSGLAGLLAVLWGGWLLLRPVLDARRQEKP